MVEVSFDCRIRPALIQQIILPNFDLKSKKKNRKRGELN